MQRGSPSALAMIDEATSSTDNLVLSSVRHNQGDAKRCATVPARHQWSSFNVKAIRQLLFVFPAVCCLPPGCLLAKMSRWSRREPPRTTTRQYQASSCTSCRRLRRNCDVIFIVKARNNTKETKKQQVAHCVKNNCARIANTI